MYQQSQPGFVADTLVDDDCSGIPVGSSTCVDNRAITVDSSFPVGSAENHEDQPGGARGDDEFGGGGLGLEGGFEEDQPVAQEEYDQNHGQLLLPIQNKRQRLSVGSPPAHPFKDKLKWVGPIPFIHSATTGAVHSGRCIMHKVHHPNAPTSIVCGEDCCIFGGQAYGGLCECLCHVLAHSYSSSYHRASRASSSRASSSRYN